MTVLEDDVLPLTTNNNRKKFIKKSTKNEQKQKKRKCKFREDLRIVPAAKKPLFSGGHNNMLNGYRSELRSNGDALQQDSPVATLSNTGNTCYLNSVLYTLRFAPTFLHNLHHLIGDLALVNARLNQHKAKTSSLGRNVSAITGPSSRSTSSKDLLSLGASNIDIPKSKVQIVTEKLHELFMTMHNLEVKESSDPYQPVAFLQAVREANSIFEGNHQQDAHELLVYLLDNIRETCDVLSLQLQQNPGLLNEVDAIPATSNNSNTNKIWNVRCSWKKNHKNKKEKNNTNKESISEEQQVNNNLNIGDMVAVESDGNCGGSSTSNSNNENAKEMQRRTKKIGYNFVAEDFEGITLRRTKCLECESVTERKEPFYDIPVPISIKEDYENNLLSPSDIYRKACVTSEKLCDANKYLCENCERYNEASRDVLFEKLPNIMVLQLKRFTTSAAGIQKVNTYLPTPLELKCFCETCCNVNENEMVPPHRYHLCCVIMHLGGAMASGHYIAYTRASAHTEDYMECARDLPKSGLLSASSSEKSINFLKYFKPRVLSSNSSGSTSNNTTSSNSNSLIASDSKNIIINNNRSGLVNGGGMRTSNMMMCKGSDCCGVKLNKSVVENVINSYPKKTQNQNQNYWNSSMPATTAAVTADDMWLECDDDNIRTITSQEFVEELAYKPNSTSTPYLLFYSKTDMSSSNSNNIIVD